MLGNLIAGFIVITVGANLIGPVSNALNSGLYNATGKVPRGGRNVTSATISVMGLIPLFFALGIMAAGVAIVVQGLKNADVM